MSIGMYSSMYTFFTLNDFECHRLAQKERSDAGH
jgi:hypothetical protein